MSNSSLKIIRQDSRYEINREFTGHPTIQWVVRFCGEWIGAYRTFEEACQCRERHAMRD